MQNPNVRSRSFRLSTLPLALAGLFAGLLPINLALASPSTSSYSSTYRAKPRHYATCASGLVGAGISEADAAAACGGALYPQELSTCVGNIGSAEIAATDALSGCRQARRPIDLASCVVSINSGASDETAALTVLDYCRRSLLPLRFSACVTGVRGETALSTADVMQSCIAASSRPRDVLPTFVPIDQGIPVTPSRIDVPDETQQTDPTMTPQPRTQPSTSPGMEQQGQPTSPQQQGQ